MKFVDPVGYFKTPSWVAKKKIHEAKAITNKPGYKEVSNERKESK